MTAALSLAWTQERADELDRLMRAATKAGHADHVEKLGREFAAIHALLVEDGGRSLRDREAQFQEIAESWEEADRWTAYREALRERLAILALEGKADETEALNEAKRELVRNETEYRELVSQWLSSVVSFLDTSAGLLASLRAGLPELAHSRFHRIGWQAVLELEQHTERLREIVQAAVVACPDGLRELIPAHLVEQVWNVRVSPLAYLRAMLNLWWSAIRHPLSETTIDLSTGRVLYRT